MKFIAIVATLTASLAMALPHDNQGSSSSDYNACPVTAYGNAQCCATDVLGLVNLDCTSPSAVPQSAEDFQDICADVGKRPRCCAVPVLGQALLCLQPAGTN
ncbi:hypothetical protein ACRALDRAFT_2105212 [Sodiomyces alcalophilus JCM 7366]|uniref:uncharacterized protein n=1 Tax=Sodiomyces alcalophilus JCM 7366 TaxID=591952 RepID=UPI0039B5365D